MAENLLAQRLRDKDSFIISAEYTVPEVSEPFEDVDALATFAAEDDRVSNVALTDRVPGMRAYDPIDQAVRAREISGKTPLVHISGKNADGLAMQALLDRLVALGLENCLVLTGDMPRIDLPDPMAAAPQGYVDAVQQAHMARATNPDMFICAAVSSIVEWASIRDFNSSATHSTTNTCFSPMQMTLLSNEAP